MDAKERILKLLEEGKITPDEAARLLEVLSFSAEDVCCQDLAADQHCVIKLRSPHLHYRPRLVSVGHAFMACCD